MKRELIISIDVERDIVRYLSESYIGMEVGMPAILDAIQESGFLPDLFIEAAIARRYPDLLRRAEREGWLVASHGKHIDPSVATDLKREELTAQIVDGIEAIKAVIGRTPTAYREANFAVDARGIAILTSLGVKVDSSILPNRIVRWHGVMPLVDHRGAPQAPYRPGSIDHRTAGTGALLEIPVTNNPANDGAPIGTGFLNWKGLDQTLSALRDSAGDPVTFLVHPWECVDLSPASRDLPDWVTSISRENATDLTRLLTLAQEWFVPSTLANVAEKFGVSLR